MQDMHEITSTIITCKEYFILITRIKNKFSKLLLIFVNRILNVGINVLMFL